MTKTATSSSQSQEKNPQLNEAVNIVKFMNYRLKEERKGESKNPPKNDSSVKTASKELK
jgi:hypothetical protein